MHAACFLLTTGANCAPRPSLLLPRTPLTTPHTYRSQMEVSKLSDTLQGSSLINDQEKAGAPLSGMLISWLSLFDFDERKKLTEERWTWCAEALMFETSSSEWELLRQRHGDADSQGLDISLLSSWFANEHSVVLDKMLRRLMKTTVSPSPLPLPLGRSPSPDPTHKQVAAIPDPTSKQVSQHVRIASLEQKAAEHEAAVQATRVVAERDRGHRINKVLLALLALSLALTSALSPNPPTTTFALAPTTPLTPTRLEPTRCSASGSSGRSCPSSQRGRASAPRSAPSYAGR